MQPSDEADYEWIQATVTAGGSVGGSCALVPLITISGAPEPMVNFDCGRRVQRSQSQRSNASLDSNYFSEQMIMSPAQGSQSPLLLGLDQLTLGSGSVPVPQHPLLAPIVHDSVQPWLLDSALFTHQQRSMSPPTGENDPLSLLAPPQRAHFNRSWSATDYTTELSPLSTSINAHRDSFLSLLALPTSSGYVRSECGGESSYGGSDFGEMDAFDLNPAASLTGLDFSWMNAASSSSTMSLYNGFPESPMPSVAFLGSNIPGGGTLSPLLSPAAEGLNGGFSGSTMLKVPEPPGMKRTLSAPEINSTKSTAGPALRKRYACEFAGCGRTFDHKSNFLEHRRTHTGERPFACDFPGCNKDYTTRNRLTVHKRDHTGERPFKCTYTNCDFATTQSSNLKKHRLTHLSPDEKQALEIRKEYECADCGKKYGNPRGFKQHMMTVHKVAL